MSHSPLCSFIYILGWDLPFKSSFQTSSLKKNKFQDIQLNEAL
ncbi:unnamed protein product [Paramecium octaurelia]|uniref:Uncharacterized protein n=1 Tax=Paramecium octaurelia TaxID=43137 RepID=A0A8S1Y9K7_PAROT|nr:unnamed protein product [Paramecium octaurelia]